MPRTDNARKIKAVLDSKQITITEATFLDYLLHDGLTKAEYGESDISTKDIAEETGMSERSAISVAANLKRKGFVKTKKKDGFTIVTPTTSGYKLSDEFNARWKEYVEV